MTGCSIVHVQPNNNPDEGRNIINSNFDCLQGTIFDLQVESATGTTIVTAGNNINIDLTMSGNVPIYEVGVVVSAITYTNTNTIPTTIGGISAGSTFSSQTMQQMWDSLLYPYQVPAFTSFSRTGLISSYEWGQSISIGTDTFNWSTSNSSSISANTIAIVQNITPVGTLYGPAANVGSTAITVTATYSAASLVSTTLYTISAKNTHGTTFNSSISATWYPKIYYGTNINTPLIASDITALVNNPLAGGFAGTYSFASGNYKYFCYPSSFGTATTFKDTSTNLAVPMETLYVVSVTNSYGININYNVHRSTNILGGSIIIQIS